jgi:glycosyltransferase involved in cell wall biosynthesis
VSGGRWPPEYPAVSHDPQRVVIVAARNEAERITETLRGVEAALPGAHVIVADSGSTDATASLAAATGAQVMSDSDGRGKGGAMTAAVRPLLGETDPVTVVLCDGDLGGSAQHLRPLAEAVESGQCDLAIAAFARKQGGGFGAAVGFSRWAIRNLTGLELRAPISGQRAMRADLLPALLPFATGFGIETAMTIDAARAGARVKEIELDLEHRATGRNLAGFLHRARQLADFVIVYLSRRLSRRAPS